METHHHSTFVGISTKPSSTTCDTFPRRRFSGQGGQVARSVPRSELALRAAVSDTWVLSRQEVDVAVNNTCEMANDIDLPDDVVREGQCGKCETRAGPRQNGKMAE